MKLLTIGLCLLQRLSPLPHLRVYTSLTYLLLLHVCNERHRRAKMTEAQRKEREAELFQLKFDEGILLSKRVLRVQPIGTDRNHNRYWVFSDGTPGLYVEKGCDICGL